jgi:hypothetical protein
VIAPLKQQAIEKVARDIKRARYLSCGVSGEELVRKVVTGYQEATRPPRRPTRRPGSKSNA